METYKLGDPIEAKRPRVHHPTGGKRMTKQSAAQECDVNAIMARYIQTGTMTHVATKAPTYGDFTGAGDYLTALNQVMDAHDQFQELPANVRAHCDNDPGKFLALVYDEGRSDELIELGLLPEQVPKTPGEKPPEDKPAGEEKKD